MVETENFTMVGLRPHLLERSYGLTLYEIVRGEEKILNDPDLQVHASEEIARKSLHRGVLSPPGTRRVMRFNEVPYEARHKIRQDLGWFTCSWDDCLVVTDLPILVSKDIKEVTEALRKFGSLPILEKNGPLYSHLKGDELFVLKKKSVMFGLPTFSLRKTRKARKPGKDPEKRKVSRRANFFRPYGTPSPALLEHARQELRAITHVKVQYCVRSHYTKPVLPKYEIRDHALAYAPAYTSFRPTTKWGLRNEIQALFDDMLDITKAVEQGLKKNEGRRFILKRRRFRVLQLLSLFSPLLPHFRNPPQVPSEKNQFGFMPGDHRAVLETQKKILTNLARIRWALRLQGDPFLPTTFDGETFHG